ncbi:hypothetical protein HCU74_13430 [Spongiibacter sp. KMU-166]|uniref:Outer membrane protein beta-barrel domain-containing protein n=1 Tax=Spongiibacter thalassae TaxID=2721624 RepID=A0ABX1GIW2_9GAMM|nr:hypothetical protein [Spongiibacter thalassae]NKI18413.1 hypothetical protein [Spongiibacter thalassae]
MLTLSTNFLRAGFVALAIAAPIVSIAETTNSTRQSFSFLGIGPTFVDYEETTTPSEDLNVRSDAHGTLLSQRSGAYVAYDDDWGFYFNTTSYIGTNTIDEEWEINDTLVQENIFSLKRTAIQLLVTRRVEGNHYAVFGGANIEKSFTRYGWTYPPQDEYQVQRETRNITEDVSQLVAYVGYEYNEFFTTKEPGWRYQFQALAGLALYSETLNNADGDNTFDASMDGYLFRFSPTVGYQLNENFMAALAVDVNINRRDEDRVTYNAEVNGQNAEVTRILPSNHFWSVSPTFNLYWSF